MAIKYICDFCGAEAKGYHEELKNGKIICKNCMEHLQKQTWRLAEEPTVYAKAKKELEEKVENLEKMTVEKILDAVEKNFRDNFDSYLGDYCIPSILLNDLPTIPLKD